MDTTLRRYQELDDASILSGIYTESGDASIVHHHHHNQQTFDPEEDDEAFRKAVQAEQKRVMREFGITPPHHHHEIITIAGEEEESIADTSLFTDASMGAPLPQRHYPDEDTITFTEVKKPTSTPETYEGSFGVYRGDDDEDDDDEDTFQPNTLFAPRPTTTINTTTTPSNEKDMVDNTVLTPRRLRLLMALLFTIVVVAVAVAIMGSFLAQDKEKDSFVPNDVQVPDLSQLGTFSPTSSPTEKYIWTETNCVDHPTIKFMINDDLGEHDCIFLQKHFALQDRLCLPDNPGHRWCPATCGLCPVEKFSLVPSRSPIQVLSMAPSTGATIAETSRPTRTPTRSPSRSPTPIPTAQPVMKPTLKPTMKPTIKETKEPTPNPTSEPTKQPIVQRTPDPTRPFTAEPTPEPTTYYYYTPEPTFWETIVDTTSEPTPAPTSSSFLCRTCPLYVCELIPC